MSSALRIDRLLPSLLRQVRAVGSRVLGLPEDSLDESGLRNLDIDHVALSDTFPSQSSEVSFVVECPYSIRAP